MKDHSHKNSTQSNKPVHVPTVTRRLASGDLVELLFDRQADRTGLVIGSGKGWRTVSSHTLGSGEVLVPYRPGNSLIRHGVVLLPERPEALDTEKALLGEIQAFIRRYVALTPDFELLAAYYILFTWVYDAFNEVPYLRILGDYGTGKTRFLLVAGAVAMRPIFASGASTVSPIFHALDAFQGTLVIDEADFRFSDEKSEIVKILNNGNVRGLPVLRTEVNAAKEFSPRAFSVFGPKIVASRKPYDDDALESRFLTERAGSAALRSDIPINLPDTYRAEAQALRNKLLAYRFKTLGTAAIGPEALDAGSPRQAQILRPLLSIVGDEDHRARLIEFATGSGNGARPQQPPVEKEVLAMLSELIGTTETPHVTLQEIAEAFVDRHGNRYGAEPSPRWIGHILRKRLGLHPRKIQGVFAIAREERPQVMDLCAKFEIAGPSDGVELVWQPVNEPVPVQKDAMEVIAF